MTLNSADMLGARVILLTLLGLLLPTVAGEGGGTGGGTMLPVITGCAAGFSAAGPGDGSSVTTPIICANCGGSHLVLQPPQLSTKHTGVSVGHVTAEHRAVVLQSWITPAQPAAAL